MKIKCPLCNKEITDYRIYQHFRTKCIHKNTISMYEFACKVKGKKYIDDLIQKYRDGYSMYELERSTVRKTLSDIPSGALIQIFTEKNIKLRNIKDTANSTRTRLKYEKSCTKKYGKGIINVSQAKEVKNAKAQTFMDHYGVDNIRKYKPFYDYVNDFMIKTYGKKRLSGWENLSELERENRSQKQAETRAINGWYDSKLEERIEKILTENNIRHKHCFWAYHHPYDFILGDHILLEINGDYWHANPKIYKSSDIMINGKTAKEIWDYDKKFRDCLQNTKFKIIYLWESDMNQMTDNDILMWLKQYL